MVLLTSPDMKRFSILPMLLMVLICPDVAFATDGLSDYIKETLVSIREITLQLILISVGIFAFVGSMIAQSQRDHRATTFLPIAFAFLAVSVLFGLLTYGNLISDLSQNSFMPSGSMRTLAFIQWTTFLVGGVLLIIFLSINAKK